MLVPAASTASHKAILLVEQLSSIEPGYAFILDSYNDVHWSREYKNTERTHYVIHNKVIELRTINGAFNDPHSHITIERKNREDAIPNAAVEGDMVYGLLSARSVAIPTKHYAFVFAGFV